MAKKAKSPKRRFRQTRADIFFPVKKILELALLTIIRHSYLVVVFVVLLLAAKGINSVLLTSEYFTIKEVEARCQEGKTSFVDDSVKLNIDEKTNIFQLDLKKARWSVENAYPEIKNVRVQRVLPDKLVITFNKREPVCQLRASGYYLVSKEAVILSSARKLARQDLFVITGIAFRENQLPKTKKLNSTALNRALELIRQIEQTDFVKRYKIREIDVRDELNPIICLEDDIQIKIGNHSFVKKERQLNEVLQDLSAKKLKPKSVDLRFDDIVVVPR
ncbi:MAG: cell division protein FtsQ/DivIB [Candidatus Omnitrophota bacterium]